MERTSGSTQKVVMFSPAAEVEADDITLVFWERLTEGRLTVQRCSDCHAYRTPPTLYCPECLSTASEWPELSGEGEIYSFIFVPADSRDPEGEVYVPALVCPKETADLKLFCGIVECDPGELRIGLKVMLAPAPAGEDRLLFRPIRSNTGEIR